MKHKRSKPKHIEFDRSKSLQQLEREDWGEPTFDSRLVTECHRLRRVPLRDFTAGNCRMMIGQQFSLPFLVPIALEFLRAEPLIDADFYEGDLIASVLRVEASFWRDHADLWTEMSEIAERAFALLPSLDDIDRATAEEVLNEAYRVFLKAQPKT